MRRNIKPLFNFDPPATPDEIEQAARQFVRKVSGMASPSAANKSICDEAVAEITETVERMFSQLATSAAPKNRELEATRARERSARRFAAVAGQNANAG